MDRAPFSLASMTEEGENPAAEGPKAEKPAQPQSKPENPAAEAPKTEKPAPEKQAENQPAQPEKGEAAKPVLSEKMKEMIRSQIAGEKIQAIFDKLQQPMEENGKKWRKYEADKLHHVNAPAPPSLDLEDLAKQYGLTAGRTGLISSWDALKFDIGSSSMVQMQGLSPFRVSAFKSLNTYMPATAMDQKGDGYLFWKINDVPESEPSFKDENVRQEVLHAWKMKEARELARKKAESLAEEANKSGATLKGAFPDIPEDKVISPPPFSMLTEGSVPRGSSLMPPRLSEVEGVPMAGMDFMRAVFNLDLNQVGVARNAPQTVVYVVQLIKYSPPQDVLWQIFLAEDFSKYVAVASAHLQTDQKAWLESLKTSAGLKWEQKPQQAPRRPPRTNPLTIKLATA